MTFDRSKVPKDFPYRIGYACQNSILCEQNPRIFCSRTCRLSTIKEKGVEYLKELGLQNLADLEKLILWNEENNIKFMRMSSDMFPFAGHEQYGYSLEYAKDELERIGALAKKLNHRLTTHPGQTNNLGSPSRKVVESTFRDLKYHAEMLDLMKLDQDSIMVIHMGGVYEDKEKAIARWEKEFLNLPFNVSQRLVLENDEYSYNTEEILPTCKKLNIPLIFDYHHHSLNPGTRPFDELFEEIQETWKRRNIRMKCHYSESRLGAETKAEKRGHSDVVKDIPMTGADCDLMIEAKLKEQAVCRIYAKYNIPVKNGVIQESVFETKKVADRTRKRKV